MGGIPELATNLEDVAGAVLRAADDTGPTLRFPAGADSVDSAKKRAELSEEAFLALAHQAFGVPKQ